MAYNPNPQPRQGGGRFGYKERVAVGADDLEKLPVVRFMPLDDERYTVRFSQFPGRPVVDDLKSCCPATWDSVAKHWIVRPTLGLISWAANMPAKGWTVEGNVSLPDKDSKTGNNGKSGGSSGRAAAPEKPKRIEVADIGDGKMTVRFSDFPPETLRNSMKATGKCKWDGESKTWTVRATQAFADWMDAAPSAGWEIDGSKPQVADAPSGQAQFDKDSQSWIFWEVENPELKDVLRGCGGSWDFGEVGWVLAPLNKKDPADVERNNYEAHLLAQKYGVKIEANPEIDLPAPRSAPDTESADVKDGLPVDLFDFQTEGAEFALSQRRSIIADEPGLGKTYQAIAAVKAANELPCIVVCPPAVMSHWEKAMQESFPDAVIAKMNKTPKGESDWPEADIAIVPYSSLRDRRRWLPPAPRSAIFDEIHYAKSPNAVRSKAAMRVAMTVPADGMVIGVSGTPMLQRTEELAHPLAITGRVKDFGGVRAFLDRYAPREKDKRKWIYARGNTIKPRTAANLEELNDKLRNGVMIRRRKSEVLTDLPPKQYQVHRLDVDDSMMELYHKIETDVAKDIAEGIGEEQSLDYGDDIREGWDILKTFEDWAGDKDKVRKAPPKSAIKAAEKEVKQGDVNIFQLRQLAAMCKLPAAIEHIENWLEGHDETEKLVIFAHHRAVINSLTHYFDAVKLDGSVSQDNRDQIIKDFQTNPRKPRVLIFSTALGPEGVTLTKASTGMFIEQPWNPGLCNQAEDRLHRISQDETVVIDYLLADTIDEHVAKLIEDKRERIRKVLDGETGEAEEGDLSVASLVADMKTFLAGKA